MKDQAQRTVVCDVCSCEFLITSVDIKKCSVEVGQTKLELTYFKCPECNQVYPILLVDDPAKYQRLADDLNATKKRIRRLQGKGNVQLLNMVQNMAMAKQNRLSQYCTGVRSRYNGTFTYVASENKYEDGKIIYRENYTEKKGESNNG